MEPSGWAASTPARRMQEGRLRPWHTRAAQHGACLLAEQIRVQQLVQLLLLLLVQAEVMVEAFHCTQRRRRRQAPGGSGGTPLRPLWDCQGLPARCCTAAAP